MSLTPRFAGAGGTPYDHSATPIGLVLVVGIIIVAAILGLGALAFVFFRYLFPILQQYYQHGQRSSQPSQQPLPELSSTLFEDHIFHYSETECIICKGDFEVGNRLITALPACRHSYHLVCIQRFLQTDRRCPMCRKVVELPAV